MTTFQSELDGSQRWMLLDSVSRSLRKTDIPISIDFGVPFGWEKPPLLWLTTLRIGHGGLGVDWNARTRKGGLRQAKHLEPR